MHVNKTGGTSVETALGGSKPRPFHPEKHMDAASMVELYGDATWEEYFTFTFVRNPWDRMLSLFLWRQRVNFIPKDLTFKNFIMNWNQWKMHRGNRYENISTDTKKRLTCMPQADWFDDKLEFNFIGRFENLQQDFDKVCDNINFKLKKLPHKYKTNHAHYSLYYDKDTRSEVGQIWGKDAELFKYNFEAS